MITSTKKRRHGEPLDPEMVRRNIIPISMKEQLLAVLCRNEDAFLAAQHKMSVAMWRSASSVYGLVWSGLLAFFEEYGALPKSPELLLVKIDSIVTGLAEEMDEEDIEEIDPLVRSFYDDSLNVADVKTDMMYYNFAKTTAREFMMEYYAQEHSGALYSPSDGTIAVDPVRVMTTMTEAIAEITSFGSINTELIFPADWDDNRTVVFQPSDVDTLDKFMTGQIGGEVMALMAPYGSSKTTTAVMAVVKAAWQADKIYSQGTQSERHKGMRPLAIYVSYETPIKEFRERVLANMAQIPRERVLTTRQKDMRTDGQDLLEYEKVEFATEIKAKIKFPSEYDRVVQAIDVINKYAVFIDMVGSSPDRPTAVGRGGVSELAVAINAVCRQRNAYPQTVWIDHAAAMAEEYMEAAELDPAQRRHLLRAIPKQAANMIAKRHDCPVWILHQLSGDANSRSPTALIHHSDADECKSFCMYVDFAFTATIPNDEMICVFRCTKHRRRPATPCRFVFVDGAYNRIIDRENVFTFDASRRKIIPKAQANSVQNDEASEVQETLTGNKYV